MRMQWIFIVGWCLLCASGCASLNVPNMCAQDYSVEPDEKRLMNRADEFVNELDHSGFVYQDPGVEKFLNQLAEDLLPDDARQTGFHVLVKVLLDPTLNAFALPNGRIYVHTGILAASDNEAQIATLLSHEMAHIIQRHSLKQSRSLKNKTAFWEAVSIPIVAGGGGLASLGGALAMISSVYGYSKDLEKEADRIGYDVVTLKGYDVNETVKMFEALDQYIKDEKEKISYFFSTHPALQSRIESYRQLITEKGGKGNKIGIENYHELTHALMRDNIRAALAKGLFVTADRTVDRAIARYPDDAWMYYLKGEVYRQRQDPPKGKKIRDKEPDWKAAIHAYDRALEKQTQFSEAMRGKGDVLYKLGRKEKARELFKQYLILSPAAEDRMFIEKLIQ